MKFKCPYCDQIYDTDDWISPNNEDLRSEVIKHTKTVHKTKYAALIKCKKCGDKFGITYTRHAELRPYLKRDENYIYSVIAIILGVIAIIAISYLLHSV